MLKQETPMGVWSDEMPPINLYNYPMKEQDCVKNALSGIDPLNPATWPKTMIAPPEMPLSKAIQTTGTKYDQEKPRMDLVDMEAIEGLAQVLTFGAKKYAAHNWRGGIAYGRIISSLLRHLSAIQRGEDIDPESGLPHIDHVGCNWMFLSYFMKNRPDLDDRWIPKK